MLIRYLECLEHITILLIPFILKQIIFFWGGPKTGEGTDEKQVTYFFGLNNNRNIASLSKSYQICIINEHSLFIYIQYGHVGVIFKQKSGSI